MKLIVQGASYEEGRFCPYNCNGWFNLARIKSILYFFNQWVVSENIDIEIVLIIIQLLVKVWY